MPAVAAVKHPGNLSWQDAAAIGMQYMTAYGGLIEVARLAPGDAVIITAASSSVGLAAIQIANAARAVSITTTRTSAKREALLSHGAQHVIATQEQNLEAVMHLICGCGRTDCEPPGWVGQRTYKGPCPSPLALSARMGLIREERDYHIN
jgi:NADPH2:quinone reductase